MKSRLKWLLIPCVIRPMASDCLLTMPRAWTLGANLYLVITASTLARLSLLTGPLFRTLETVAMETPASLAISTIVIGLFYAVEEPGATLAIRRHGVGPKAGFHEFVSPESFLQ